MLASLLQAGLPWLAEKVMEIGKDKAEELVKEKIGIDIDLDEVNNLPKSDLQKLKDLDAKLKFEIEKNRHIEEVFKHNERMFKLVNEDTKDARELTEKIIDNEDEYVAHFTINMSYIIVGLTFLYIFGVIILGTLYKVPQEIMHIIDMGIGMVGTYMMTVLKHWFGSYQEQKQSKELARMEIRK